MAVASTGENAIGGDPYAKDFRYAVLRYAPDSYPPRSGTHFGVPIIFALWGEVYGVAVDYTNGHVYSATGTVIREYGRSGALLETLDEEGTIGFSSRDVDVLAENHEVFASANDIRREEWVVNVYAGKNHRLTETIRGVAGDPSPPYPSIAVNQANGDLYVEDFTRSGVRLFKRNRRSGRYEPVGSIPHEEYLERPEAGADLVIDESPKSPNRGYLFVTSGRGSDGHVYAFSPK